MKPAFLLCSDLDRTILPNGSQPESPQSRRLLGAVAARPELSLVYVSGRHEALLHEAVMQYGIPEPDYAIGDVGTTIYKVTANRWQPWQEWEETIAPDWNGAHHADLLRLFADLDILCEQESEKQNTFKLSYYTPSQFDSKDLLEEMQNRLRQQQVLASLIWSVDEASNKGLLDVLPASATKLHAIEFLMEYLQFGRDNTVFAGDSGNDLPVVTSGRLQSVLVKNAHPEVIQQAKTELARKNALASLYLARGGLLGMNGNYSAGVLEGLVHFIPAVRAWLN